MKIQTIPATNLQAALVLLQPHCPDLSATALIKAIRQYEPATTSPNRLIDKHEAAKLLGLTHWRVVELAREGTLPGVKMNGTRWRFRERELLAWAEYRQQGGHE